ncbi:hypothetical protein GCM10009096_04680 [Parasphingorhabdus litoris]|uniref:HTH iclR-type domain-containing protein n=1 Tax=Parasphingorhabdus litoris TaxID=394733 RepID=A0ABN1A403_9SPHN|nr:helix-turn-helix domain-containing protein [Parasphingorhabdus litoris]
MAKVSAEIAAIKSVLAEVAEQIENLDGMIARPGDAPTSDAFLNNSDVDDVELINRAKTLLEWSRFKAQTLNLGSGLFSDSCWDMCLDIYICDLKDEKITISSIAHSSGIPMTTAMRYINVMTEEGLLEKSSNPSDNRMVFISTSDDCKEKISTILRNLR